jgi:putative inorganic carbon (HCO3(-)) transporter
MLTILGLGLAARRRWMMGLAGLSLLVFAVALVASLSRSGWLGFLVGVVALAVLLPERRKQVAGAAGAVAAAMVLLGLVGPIGLRLTNGLDTFSARWDIWGQALALIAHHPVFGVGVMNFQSFLPLDDSGNTIPHAHNIFLNMAAERGLPGLAAFCFVVVMLFKILRASARKVRERFDATALERALPAALTAAFIGYFVHSLLDVSYYDYKVVVLFWLMVGVAASLPLLFGPPDATQASPRRQLTGVGERR